jgi:hypothetical protein
MHNYWILLMLKNLVKFRIFSDPKRNSVRIVFLLNLSPSHSIFIISQSRDRVCIRHILHLGDPITPLLCVHQCVPCVLRPSLLHYVPNLIDSLTWNNHSYSQAYTYVHISVGIHVYILTCKFIMWIKSGLYLFDLLVWRFTGHSWVAMLSLSTD